MLWGDDMSWDHVVELADVANNGCMWSPQQALNSALQDVGHRGAFKCGKRLLVLALDDSDGDYNISFVQAGMSMSECLALCEVAKTVFLAEMGYGER